MIHGGFAAHLIKVVMLITDGSEELIAGRNTVLNNGGLMIQSKRTFRAKNTTNRREYKLTIVYVEPWDDSERFCYNKIAKGCVGCWKKRLLYPSEYRSSRTWKHNRKTQYKCY